MGTKLRFTILTEGKDHLIVSLGWKQGDYPVGVSFSDLEGIKVFVEGKQVYPEKK